MEPRTDGVRGVGSVVAPKKQNRQVTVGLAHLNRRRVALVEKRAELDAEIGHLEAAIKALESCGALSATHS